MGFKVGDLVRLLNSKTDYTYEVVGVDIGWAGYVRIQKPKNGGNTTWSLSVRSTELELVAKGPASNSLCECGSNKLKHPGHSFWCPSRERK